MNSVRLGTSVVTGATSWIASAYQRHSSVERTPVVNLFILARFPFHDAFAGVALAAAPAGSRSEFGADRRLADQRCNVLGEGH